MEALSNEVHLLADNAKLVARDSEAEGVKRVLIDLQIIDSSIHGFTSRNVFISIDHAGQPAFEFNSVALAANDVSRQMALHKNS